MTHRASQYYRGSQLVEGKSKEIPAVRQLVAQVGVAGRLIGIDALHTQMGLENQRRAFALVNSKASRALEAS